jgi:mono/diheme cytochrome c family protein
VKRLAGAVLILVLAACSKQEPPPAVASAPTPATKPQPAPPAAAGTTAPAAPDPAATAALLKQGEELFSTTCATCHMADGGGVPNMQPSIIGSAWISNPDPQLLLSLVLRGAAVMGEAANAYDNKMPPLDHLSDTEIAAVSSYVRQRFAAAPITTPVTPAQVAIARSRPGLPQ